MDVGEIRDLVRRPSRPSTWLVVAAGLLLTVPIAWSLRPSRTTTEATDRTGEAQADGRQGRPLEDASVRRSRHQEPEEIERVRKLYDEIEGLTQIRDQVDQALGTDRIYAPRKPKAPPAEAGKKAAPAPGR